MFIRFAEGPGRAGLKVVRRGGDGVLALDDEAAPAFGGALPGTHFSRSRGIAKSPGGG